MTTFRLPDFRKHDRMNDLRRQMGAELVEFALEATAARRPSHRDAQRLATTGISVAPEEIETLENGVFAYQGVPVLLYIFAPTQWHDTEMRLPKYHLCNCRTWFSMKASGRSDRYVASTRVDGFFELDVYGVSGVPNKRTERLNVCQNCLAQLKWNGFKNDLPSRVRQRHVESFSLDAFFQHYRRPMVREKPRWTPKTSPSGSYSDDFDELSSRMRAAAGWRCQEPDCRRLLSAIWQRRYLHLHHRNGVKGDNRPENLMVVCLECHARQPGHEHMKRTKDHLDFMKLFTLAKQDAKHDAESPLRVEARGISGSRDSVVGSRDRRASIMERVIVDHVPLGKTVLRETLLREVAHAMRSPLTREMRSQINTTIARLQRNRAIATDSGWKNVWRVQ